MELNAALDAGVELIRETAITPLQNLVDRLHWLAASLKTRLLAAEFLAGLAASLTIWIYSRNRRNRVAAPKG
jgi:hypothetical protein